MRIPTPTSMDAGHGKWNPVTGHPNFTNHDNWLDGYIPINDYNPMSTSFNQWLVAVTSRLIAMSCDIPMTLWQATTKQSRNFNRMSLLFFFGFSFCLVKVWFSHCFPAKIDSRLYMLCVCIPMSKCVCIRYIYIICVLHWDEAGQRIWSWELDSEKQRIMIFFKQKCIRRLNISPAKPASRLSCAGIGRGRASPVIHHIIYRFKWLIIHYSRYTYYTFLFMSYRHFISFYPVYVESILLIIIIHSILAYVQK